MNSVFPFAKESKHKLGNLIAAHLFNTRISSLGANAWAEILTFHQYKGYHQHGTTRHTTLAAVHHFALKSKGAHDSGTVHDSCMAALHIWTQLKQQPDMDAHDPMRGPHDPPQLARCESRGCDAAPTTTTQ